MSDSDRHTEHTAEEKTATTLELFFDLVFVFAITQVVFLLAHDLTWSGLFHAVILLGILWWGWTNWTWITNLVSLEPRGNRVILLIGMAGIFIMAYAVPDAFEGEGIWVALPYVGIQLVGIVLMFMDPHGARENMDGFLKYAPINMAGALLLIVGALAGDAQEWFWFASLVVNVIAAVLGGREVWDVDAGHFSERHGLIMIIALGEAIIAVGASLEAESSWELAGYLGTGIALAMTLYWAYFDRAQEIWEEGLRKATEGDTGAYARDVYSMTHFPMIVGIVVTAVVLEVAFLQPHDPLYSFVRWLFVIGVGSFLLAISAAAWRANRVILRERLAAVAIVGVIVFGLPDLAAPTTVLMVTITLVLTMYAEWARFRRYFAANPVDASEESEQA